MKNAKGSKNLKPTVIHNVTDEISCGLVDVETDVKISSDR